MAFITFLQTQLSRENPKTFNMNCLGNESVDETLQLHHMKYASMYKDEELQGNCINASTVCLCLLILIWHVEMLKVKTHPLHISQNICQAYGARINLRAATVGEYPQAQYQTFQAVCSDWFAFNLCFNNLTILYIYSIHFIQVVHHLSAGRKIRNIGPKLLWLWHQALNLMMNVRGQLKCISFVLCFTSLDYFCHNEGQVEMLNLGAYCL